MVDQSAKRWIHQSIDHWQTMLLVSVDPLCLIHPQCSVSWIETRNELTAYEHTNPKITASR